MQAKQFTGRFTITDQDYFVREHTVNGIHIMPGVTFLDMIFKTLTARSLDPSTVELRHIMFLEPIVTTQEFDRKVDIRIFPSESAWLIEATSTKWKDGELKASTVSKHLTAQLCLEAIKPEKPIDLSRIREKTSQVIDLDACYAITRKVGIDHDNFMKCRGQVYNIGSGCLGEIQLSPIAQEHSSNFILHPVFLDCATIVPLYYAIPDQEKAELYIPFYIESFSGKSLAGRDRCYVYVENPSASELTEEISYRSFALCDQWGNQLARFRNFGIKRVHDLQGIKQLTRLTSIPKQDENYLSVERQEMFHARLTSSISELNQPEINREPKLQALTEFIHSLICQYTFLELSDNTLQTSFFELGLDSTHLLEISHTLEAKLEISLYPTLLFECPTIGQLADFLIKKYPEAVQNYLSNPIYPLSPLTPLNKEQNLDIPYPLSKGDNGFWGTEYASPSGETPSIAPQASPFSLKPKILIPKWQPISSINSEHSGALNSVPKSSEITLMIFCQPYPLLSQQMISWLSSDTSYLITIGQFYQNWQDGGSAQVREEQEDDWDRLLAQLKTLSQVYFVVPPSPSTVDNDYSHISGFRAIKALIRSGLMQQSLDFKIITFNSVQVFADESFNPQNSGLWGLGKSFSHEYPHCRVTCLDFAQAELENSWFQGQTTWLQAFLQDEKLAGKFVAVRQQKIYSQSLYELAVLNQKSCSQFKHGGTYMIIGGTGGLGLSLSCYLRQTYAANIVLVGRSPIDEQLAAKIAHLGKRDQEILYLQAHCDQVNQLSLALLKTKQKFGKVDGIIHSAMILDDVFLAQMSEESFSSVLRPKVAGAIALAQATLDEDLDFILFFSSLQSFVGNQGQGNYATASTFLDGYARQMAQHRSYPVCVINWGYWGSVGAVANQKYRELMLRQGMHSIEIAEGMEALETIFASCCSQAIVVKAEKQLLLQLGLAPDILIEQRILTESPTYPLKVTLWDEDVWATARRRLVSFKQGMDCLMDAAATALVGILKNIGLFSNSEKSYTLLEAIQVAQISREQHNLFAEMLNFLVTAGYLSRAQNRFLLTKNRKNQADEFSLADWQQAGEKLVERQPELENFYYFLSHCFQSYQPILQGKMSANQALFPNNSLKWVEQIYTGNLVSDIYNELIANALVEQIRARLKPGSSQAPLKVLEVGAGTGGTTRHILKLLTEQHLSVDYTYTDVWFKCLEHGREKFAQAYPSLNFSILDISLDPEKQGFVEPFDMVIATNAIHATTNIRQSLRHLKKLLKPMGCLLLNESIKPQNFSTLTFGLLKGWWNCQDKDVRYPASPLLSEQTWKRLLQEEGFLGIQELVPTQTDSETLVQQVFCTSNDGQILKPCGVESNSKPVLSTDHLSSQSLPMTIREQLKPVDLHRLYGCTRQQFTCLDSYLDSNGCLWLFLNAPNGNALSIDLLDELLDLLNAFSHKQASLSLPKIVYLSHYGKYFSLGGDRSLIVDYLQHRHIDTLKTFATKVTQVIQGIVSLDALVVAVVQGTAQGGGLEMLLCSDFQFVHSRAKLGLPEVKTGLIPGMGGLSFLKQQIGLLRTKQLVITGGLLNAQEAQEIGLISYVADDPLAKALHFYDKIDNFDTAIYLKKYVDNGKGLALTQDINNWVEYLVNHGGWVDVQKISKFLTVVNY